MLPFVHERQQRLGQLLQQSSAVLDKYNRLDLDLQHALADWLDQAVAVYRALQRPATENQMLALKAQLVAAGQGLNPQTLAPVATHRRALLRAAALDVLQQSSAQLRADVGQDEALLADAREQLRPIVLMALQKGYLAHHPRKPLGTPQLEALWRHCTADADIRLAAQQLALKLSHPDIVLLLAELTAALH